MRCRNHMKMQNVFISVKKIKKNMPKIKNIVKLETIFIVIILIIEAFQKFE